MLNSNEAETLDNENLTIAVKQKEYLIISSKDGFKYLATFGAKLCYVVTIHHASQVCLLLQDAILQTS